jgi:hypothetical protein
MAWYNIIWFNPGVWLGMLSSGSILGYGLVCYHLVQSWGMAWYNIIWFNPGVWLGITGLTLQYLCVCLKPGPTFPLSFVNVFLIFFTILWQAS